MSSLSDYENFVESKLSPASRASDKDRVITGAMGICGEAGELMDHIKKWLYHGNGHPLDQEYVKLELGDLLFYISVEAAANGLTLSEVIEANIAKLNGRYKAGFTSEESANRAEGRPEARQRLDCDAHYAATNGITLVCARPFEHTGWHRASDGFEWP
jgi:NTP pyrophosphatase (non-canonical NTP hydrolase)